MNTNFFDYPKIREESRNRETIATEIDGTNRRPIWKWHRFKSIISIIVLPVNRFLGMNVDS